MKRMLSIPTVFLLIFAMAGVAGAALVNGGFETGNSTGWASTGNAVVVPSATTYDGTTINPVEGAYFALVTAGSADFFHNISQSVTMATGDWLSGRALFCGWDYLIPEDLPFYPNDYAAVRIFDSGGGQLAQPWYRDISQVGDYGHTGWEFWTWTAPGAGTYTLSLGAANIGDDMWASRGFFDANVSGAVPIPGAVVLLGSGLIGLAGLGWRRRSKT